MTAPTVTTPGTSVPSGPRGSLLLGNLGDFRRDMTGFLERTAREYGPMASLRFAHMRFVLVSEPDGIEEVLVRQHRNFVKNVTEPVWPALLGNGLLLSDGEFWLRQRRLMQPAFHRRRIDHYGRTVVEYTERALARWGDGQVRDVHDDMTRLTLEVVARTLFDADVAHRAPAVGRALEAVLAEFSAQILRPLPIPMVVPTPGNIRFRRARARLDAIIRDVIDERRREGTDRERDDLLSVLLTAEDDDGHRMTDRQLRDEVMTLFLAGHETTAILLSWIWHLLARNPGVEAKLVAEIDVVLGGATPSVETLPRLPFAARVVKEALRLYPPVWTLEGRRAILDCTIAGREIRAGTVLLLSPWVTHRDPRFYPNPERFDPDRWTDDLAARLPRYAFFPFGGGQRLCIGQSFAEMEALLILATTLGRYRLSEAPGRQDVTVAPSVTLRPSGGMPMRVCRR